MHHKMSTAGLQLEGSGGRLQDTVTSGTQGAELLQAYIFTTSHYERKNVEDYYERLRWPAQLAVATCQLAEARSTH